MSLYSAFYSGLSGLSTNSSALNVIGNNLSNINTVGFKGSDMTFRDIFSTAGASSTQGNGNPIQFGLGVQMNSVNQNFAQSSFQSTGNALDMAIQGNGFFTLQTASGSQVFSRAGNFTRNSDGYLVASDGANVMGWNRTGANGAGSVVTTGAAVPIQISAATAGAQATANVGLNVNLNASADLGSTYSSPVQVYDSLGHVQNMVVTYTKATEAQSPSTSLSFSGVNLDPTTATAGTAGPTPGFVYDSQGVKHTLAITYTKTANANEWTYDITDAFPGAPASVGSGTINWATGSASVVTVAAPLTVTSASSVASTIAFSPSNFSNNSTGNTAGTLTEVGGNPTGNLTWTYNVRDAAVNPDGTPRTAVLPVDGLLGFDASGNLVQMGVKGAPINNPTTKNNPVITIPWLTGTSNTITLDIMGATGTSNFTGLSSANATISSTQDGYPAGTLQSMTVDQDGIISGTFTNGQILNLAQLSLSSFTNTNGLQQSGNNHWSQTLASGAPTIGVANAAGRGGILGSNLELSNVDVASEFTKLIVSQRGYQANAKIVTTTDELLQVTLNLKQ
ncbi:MAG: flagellar hook-basal body complex protein [Holophagaceae bacterium]|nr:flagellar hook-basal body complex protein [Holophagaceae bacterium]